MTEQTICNKARIVILKCATNMNISEQNDYLRMLTDYLEAEAFWSKNRIHTDLGVSIAFLKDRNVTYSENREDELLILIGKAYTVIVENGLEI